MVIDDVDAIGGLVGISKVIGVEIVPSSYILVGTYLKGVIDYDETKSLLKKLATKRGWEQSVLYETAIIMLDEAIKLAWYKGNNKSMRKIMAIRDLQNSMIEITDSPDIKQWSDFVYNHEYGNIFQTPEMTEVSKRTKNYEPASLSVVKKKR